ncbi:MAG: sulfurtransferase TusA family protein [Pseudomonadota bacterium]
MESQPSQTLDTRGQLCPLPVLKARKRLQGMGEGEVLRVEATDPMSVIDFPHFCEESGHELLGQAQEGDVYMFDLRKRASRR